MQEELLLGIIKLLSIRAPLLGVAPFPDMLIALQMLFICVPEIWIWFIAPSAKKPEAVEVTPPAASRHVFLTEILE